MKRYRCLNSNRYGDVFIIGKSYCESVVINSFCVRLIKRQYPQDWAEVGRYDFILPEKWVVKGCTYLTDWARKFNVSELFYCHYDSYYFPKERGSLDAWKETDEIPNGYEEIDASEFIEYIVRRLHPDKFVKSVEELPIINNVKGYYNLSTCTLVYGDLELDYYFLINTYKYQILEHLDYEKNLLDSITLKSGTKITIDELTKMVKHIKEFRFV